MKRGRKDITKLVKKVITTKDNRRMTVYVKPDKDKEEKKSLLDIILEFFGFKTKEELGKEIKKIYQEHEIEKKFGVGIQDFGEHIQEYFRNRAKWVNFFTKMSGKPLPKGGRTEGAKNKEKRSGTGEKKKYNLELMKYIHELIHEGKYRKEESGIEGKEEETRRKERTSEKKEKFSEVGEHVWGARKDLYAEYKKHPTREISSTDLEELEKQGVAVGLVTKERFVGKKEDFKAKMESFGVPSKVAYCAYQILRRIGNPKDDPKSRRHYILMMRRLYLAIQNWRTIEDVGDGIIAFRDEIDGYVLSDDESKEYNDLKEKIEKYKSELTDENSYYYPKTEKDKELREKIKEAIRRSHEIIREARIRAEKDENSLSNMYKALGQDFVKYIKDWKKTSKLLRQVGHNRDASDWRWVSSRKGGDKSTLEEKKERFKWKRRVPEEVERVTKVADKEYTSQALKDEYGFKNVQFGNWMDTESSREHVQMCGEAFADMAYVLGVDPKHLTMNGRLSIAFGARGKGSAAAHYEPMGKIINVTKIKGGGSLAHEWGHFLDNVIAMLNAHEEGKGGNQASFITGLGYGEEAGKLPGDVVSALKEVKDAIYKGSVVPAEKKTIERPRYNYLESEELDNFAARVVGRTDWANTDDETIKSIIQEYIRTKAAISRSYTERYEDDPKYVMRLEQKHKNIVLRNVEYFAQYLDKPIEVVIPAFSHSKVTSKYYQESISAGQYWSRPEELFARAFETYISDKLESKGMKNTYLVSGVSEEDCQFYEANYGKSMYPMGEEREKINNAIDKLIKAVVDNKLLEKAMEKLNNMLFKTVIGKGKKDKTKLVKKVIVDKLGRTTTVYVNPDKEKDEEKSLLDKILEFFNLKTKRELAYHVKNLYKNNFIKERFNVTVEEYAWHIGEYFRNRSKWDNFFTKMEGKPLPKGGRTEGAKNRKKREKAEGQEKRKVNLELMRYIHRQFAGQKKYEEKPKKEEAGKEPVKEKETKKETQAKEGKGEESAKKERKEAAKEEGGDEEDVLKEFRPREETVKTIEYKDSYGITRAIGYKTETPFAGLTLIGAKGVLYRSVEDVVPATKIFNSDIFAKNRMVSNASVGVLVPEYIDIKKEQKRNYLIEEKEDGSKAEIYVNELKSIMGKDYKEYREAKYIEVIKTVARRKKYNVDLIRYREGENDYYFRADDMKLVLSYYPDAKVYVDKKDGLCAIKSGDKVVAAIMPKKYKEEDFGERVESEGEKRKINIKKPKWAQEERVKGESDKGKKNIQDVAHYEYGEKYKDGHALEYVTDSLKEAMNITGARVRSNINAGISGYEANKYQFVNKYMSEKGLYVDTTMTIQLPANVNHEEELKKLHGDIDMTDKEDEKKKQFIGKVEEMMKDNFGKAVEGNRLKVASGVVIEPEVKRRRMAAVCMEDRNGERYLFSADRIRMIAKYYPDMEFYFNGDKEKPVLVAKHNGKPVAMLVGMSPKYIETRFNEENRKKRKLTKALPPKPSEDEPLPVGAHRTPPKGYPKDKWEYADPNNYKYPLDTEKHVRAALAYFSKPENYTLYSPDERVTIWRRIVRAAKKYGIEVEDKEKFKAWLVEGIMKARDISKLQKKVITDKHGVKRTVYVREDEKKKQIKNEKEKKDGGKAIEERKKQIAGVLRSLLDMVVRQYRGEGTEYEAEQALREAHEGQKRVAEIKRQKKNRRNEKRNDKRKGNEKQTTETKDEKKGTENKEESKKEGDKK